MDLMNCPPGKWPRELFRAVHILLNKNQRYELNKDTRPIKIMSEVIRVPNTALTHNSGAYGHR